MAVVALASGFVRAGGPATSGWLLRSMVAPGRQTWRGLSALAFDDSDRCWPVPRRCCLGVASSSPALLAACAPALFVGRPLANAGLLAQFRRGVSSTAAPAFRGSRSAAAAADDDDDPYRLLGVERSSSDKDIKLAYLRKAKLFHPDLNPNNPEATRQFQRLSVAYTKIKDAQSRRAYQQEQSSGSGSGSAQSSRYAYTADHSRDVFDSAYEDMAMIKEVAQMFFDDMRQNLSESIDAAAKDDLSKLRSFFWEYKSFFGILLVPLLLVRLPIVIPIVLKFGLASGLMRPSMLWHITTSFARKRHAEYIAAGKRPK